MPSSNGNIKKRWLSNGSAFFCLTGGAAGNRTPDLVIANDALSQLSYSPVFSSLPA